MKNIGVLTFHNGPNFGGFMQAWHVVNAVRECGHNGYAVNYLHEDHDRANQINIPLKSIAALKGRIFWYLKSKGFKGLGDSLAKHPYTTNPANVPWDDFDGFVTGSDIVWEYEDPNFGHDPAYFGGLEGQQGKPIMSYAASCGPANPDGELPNYIREGLAKFEALGVRDPSTARLVENACGRESELVVDPTWLNADPEVKWSKRPKGKYVFVYGGKVDPKMGEALSRYCKDRGLKLISALTSCPWADHKYHSLHPFQWVDLFRNAEATAIVGTLHGTLFSMKYNQPMILVNGPRVAPKIEEVMKRTGQGFRVFESGNIGDEQLKLLDKDAADLPTIPEDWRQDSKAFLKRSLERF